jgi:hypothetical protein
MVMPMQMPMRILVLRPSTPVRRCKARRATQVVTSYKDAESSPDLTPQLKQPPPARPPPPSASEVVLNSARLHSIMNGNDAVDTPDAPNTPKRRDQLLMVMKGLGLDVANVHFPQNGFSVETIIGQGQHARSRRKAKLLYNQIVCAVGALFCETEPSACAKYLSPKYVGPASASKKLLENTVQLAVAGHKTTIATVAQSLLAASLPHKEVRELTSF